MSVLQPGDQLSLVTFASESKVLLPLTTMDAAGKNQANTMLTAMEAYGMTHLWSGIETGYNVFPDDDSFM